MADERLTAASSTALAPEVSIVIPTRDRANCIVMAVLAALGQRGVDLEVVVVDDGSRDGTQAALAGVADSRLIVVRNEAPQGVSAARNRGIERARGRWVAFLDDDDLWSPDTLRLQLDAATREKAVFAYCDSVALDERLNIIGSITPPDGDGIGRALQRWNFIGGPSVVVADARTVRRLGGFDEALSVLADWDLWIRLADAGRAAHCSSMLVGYVVHAGGMFTQQPAVATADVRELTAKHRARGARLGLEPDVGRMLVAMAYGHARAGRRARAAGTAVRAAVPARSPRYAALGHGLLVGHRTALALRRRLSGTVVPPAPPWLSGA
ncbi:MAG TPA: glycosyltransferase, partial [Solirubrobacteraceae bacterium]